MSETLYVSEIAPALKHPTIFQKFDALEQGESLTIVNDHDPIPLFYELRAERGDIFEWLKKENGPETWTVVITKFKDAQKVSGEIKEEKTEAKNDDIPVINVTLLEPKMKHPTIFAGFDALQPGQTFQILNDHDPKPLYYQMLAERGPVFKWEYIENGPKWWRVQITKNTKDQSETIGQIVAKDIRKANVFKKFGIDFCCGGKKSLKQACEEANVSVETIEAALKDTDTSGVNKSVDYTKWDADFLADYIYNQHHKCYYEESPIIADLLKKVYTRHGDRHPELAKLYDLYLQLSTELNGHFMKEERVVFPFIKALVTAQKTGDYSDLQAQPSLKDPIQIMEIDHDAAGDILAQISKLTGNYTPPENSCNSFRLLYSKLQDLQDDLQQHIHLENNILFPKALEIEKAIRSKS